MERGGLKALVSYLVVLGASISIFLLFPQSTFLKETIKSYSILLVVFELFTIIACLTLLRVGSKLLAIVCLPFVLISLQSTTHPLIRDLISSRVFDAPRAEAPSKLLNVGGLWLETDSNITSIWENFSSLDVLLIDSRASLKLEKISGLFNYVENVISGDRRLTVYSKFPIDREVTTDIGIPLPPILLLNIKSESFGAFKVMVVSPPKVENSNYDVYRTFARRAASIIQHDEASIVILSTWFGGPGSSGYESFRHVSGARNISTEKVLNRDMKSISGILRPLRKALFVKNLDFEELSFDGEFLYSSLFRSGE